MGRSQILIWTTCGIRFTRDSTRTAQGFPSVPNPTLYQSKRHLHRCVQHTRVDLAVSRGHIKILPFYRKDLLSKLGGLEGTNHQARLGLDLIDRLDIVNGFARALQDPSPIRRESSRAIVRAGCRAAWHSCLGGGGLPPAPGKVGLHCRPKSRTLSPQPS